MAPIDQPTPGKLFTATAWVRGDNVLGEGYVALAWFTANGQYISGTRSASIPRGDTPWKPLKVSDTMPAAASFVQVFLTARANPGGTVCFDDFSSEARR